MRQDLGMALPGLCFTVSHKATIKMSDWAHLEGQPVVVSSISWSFMGSWMKVSLTYWWLARDCSQFLAMQASPRWQLACSRCASQRRNRESVSKTEVIIFCNGIMEVWLSQRCCVLLIRSKLLKERRWYKVVNTRRQGLPSRTLTTRSLSDNNTNTLAFFQLIFAWYPFFYLFT